VERLLKLKSKKQTTGNDEESHQQQKKSQQIDKPCFHGRKNEVEHWKQGMQITSMLRQK
jgi:hypothetical protein